MRKVKHLSVQSKIWNDFGWLCLALDAWKKETRDEINSSQRRSKIIVESISVQFLLIKEILGQFSSSFQYHYMVYYYVLKGVKKIMQSAESQEHLRQNKNTVQLQYSYLTIT